MDEKRTNIVSIYRIRVKGILDSSVADWLGGISLIPQENNETVLTGQFADQAALRGLLDQLWNLNFTILYLERMEHEHNP